MPSKPVVSRSFSNKTFLLVAVLGSLSAHDCLAVGLPLISSNKKTPLQAQGYEKLTTGAGPTTNDVASVPAVAPSGEVNQNGNDLPSALKPLTLHDEENIDQASGGDPGTGGGGVLKSTVSTTDYIPKQGDSREMQSKSVKGNPDAKTLVKQASKVGLGPVQLVESEEETNKKVDAILTAEQMELNDLWEATLAKSPDIQFIVQKLQPTSNPAHLSTILTRMLSTAAFGGMGAVAMMSPNPGMYAATSAGGSMISQVLGMKEKSDAKRAKLSQEEELVMFKMVRDTCDKLVGCYREYKKNTTSLERAVTDLQDLKAMVADAHGGQDGAKQLEMEYTLRKQQRDIDSVAEDVRRDRQSLIDLAGGEAVEKLDKQLAEEHSQVQQKTALQNAPTSVEDGSKEIDAATTTTTVVDNQPSAQAAKTDAQTEEAGQDDKAAKGKQETKETASTDHSPQS